MRCKRGPVLRFPHVSFIRAFYFLELIVRDCFNQFSETSRFSNRFLRKIVFLKTKHFRLLRRNKS